MQTPRAVSSVLFQAFRMRRVKKKLQGSKKEIKLLKKMFK